MTDREAVQQISCHRHACPTCERGGGPGAGSAAAPCAGPALVWRCLVAFVLPLVLAIAGGALVRGLRSDAGQAPVLAGILIGGLIGILTGSLLARRGRRSGAGESRRG